MSDETVNGNDCINRMDGRRCKVGKEGRKGVAFENVQKEKDYSKDILHNEIGNETRGKVSRRLQPTLVPSFLSLPSVSCPHRLSHGTFISRSSCGTEQFSLTFFTLQLLLLFGQHFASVLKTYCPSSKTKKLVWKDLFQMSVWSV